MSDFITTPLMASVHLADDNPVFGDSAVHITMTDEAGGPFFTLSSIDPDSKAGEIRIDPDQLRALAKEAERMLKEWKPSW